MSFLVAHTGVIVGSPSAARSGTADVLANIIGLGNLAPSSVRWLFIKERDEKAMRKLIVICK